MAYDYKFHYVDKAFSRQQDTPPITVFKAGDRIDIKIRDNWVLDYATINKVNENSVIATMNHPGHDGCKWTHEYEFQNIRLAQKH